MAPPASGPNGQVQQALPGASHAKQGCLRDRAISYHTCVAIFLLVVIVAVLTPFKEYYLGSYVTKPFDEVRDDIVARKLDHLGVVTSGAHYFDTFDRERIPLVDLESTARLARTNAAPLGLVDFLVRANVRRADLLENLPEELLARRVNLMEDVYAPLCGSAASASWDTKPQLLFGNWFPVVRHEFCRDFHDKFPRDRFFNSIGNNGKAPTAAALASVGSVTLGLIAVVNMSELYLRHFDDPLVIRKIMKNVQEGYVGVSLPAYSDAVAGAIVERYAKGISLAETIALLPASFDADHIALVDVLGVQCLLDFYLAPQQLTMGVNVNGESAIMAEVTHATAAYFTSDFLINTVGMHLVSTMHLAPFWDCAIQHTTMDKAITVSDVDAAAITQCGRELANILPTFAVNLMFLFQKDQRDYAKLDNTTTYTLGRHREADPLYVTLDIPDKLSDSPLQSMDGTAWTKARTDQPAKATTPYGYLFTPDCKSIVDSVMLQGGRNVQKYQAYLGDGLGTCVFRDSQETPPQTLCRLFMTSGEILFKALNGSLLSVPSCASLVSVTALPEIQAQQQDNLRQIEWFMIDTELLARRIRIQDNTSRQIRTFLLILNLIGATYYVIEFLRILKSVWVFVRNSVYRSPAATTTKYTFQPKTLRLVELLQCDPSVGALQHPGTMVLLFLGAVGALSNIFSLGCTAQLSTARGGVVVYCKPAIPISSFGLVFTTLSSSYWVILVTLQTRSFTNRVHHAVRSDFVRFWGINAVAVLSIYFLCKLAGDYFFQNVELSSDPHILAIFGGLALTGLISFGFLFVHMASTDYKRLRRMTRHRSVDMVRRASAARTAKERIFLGKWSASQLDSVLHNCATPQIAQQLEIFSTQQKLDSAKSNRNVLDAAATTSASASGIHIHEFVAVHCAAGSHAHLESVAWDLQDDGRACVTVVDARGAAVIPTIREGKGFT